MLRRITCACALCKEFIKHPWKPGVSEKYQPRFAHNRLCKYWENFKGENDWIPVQTTPPKGVNPLDIEQSKKEAQEGIMKIMEETMKEYNYGAVMI